MPEAGTAWSGCFGCTRFSDEKENADQDDNSSNTNEGYHIYLLDLLSILGEPEADLG
jgi:hypothetical protein